MAYSLEIEGLVAHKHKLEAEIERLRAALQEIADFSGGLLGDVARKALANEQSTPKRRNTHFERDGCDPPEWHGPTGE